LMIQAQPNKEVEKKLDEIIDIIAQAQADDGYLYASHQTGSIHVREMGEKPYSHVIHSHELYNVGHLYEAAVAYKQATGKDNFLKIAEKSADHVNKVIFEGDPNYNGGKPVNQAPGHEEIELGLLKLYRLTGKKKYLEMAKKFLDIRGVTFIPKGKGVDSPTYAQQHKPVAEQRKAVGHAVRAGYLYAAMAEVDSILGTETYTEALSSIWHDIVDTKMHITGGLGATHGIEGFGPEYDLPNENTYNETCAAVANVLFNYRMFLKFKDAKYVDVAEVSLLNNSLAGMSLDGKKFFYPNPLEADTRLRQRQGWFGCACCPSNIARLIPQISGYLYATSGDSIYCTFYGGNSADIAIPSGTVKLQQVTDYPFSGKVAIQVASEKPQKFALKLRIPTWCGEQFVPGKLYSYVGGKKGNWELRLNSEVVKANVEKGFVTIDREWKKGDKVELALPLEPRLNKAIEQVKADNNRLAVTYGPLVYCAEEVDNGGKVQRFFLGKEPKMTTTELSDGPLAGYTEISVSAFEKTVKENKPANLRLVPYFAWANRGRATMIVWVPTTEELAKVDITLAKERKFASVSATHTFEKDTTDALQLPSEPKSSKDKSIPRWTSWPQTGKKQWIELDLGKEKEVASVGIYWYDDSPEEGGVQVPKDWYLETRQSPNDPWKFLKIYNTDQYSVLKDCYNTVHPAEKLKTRYLRIAARPKNEKTTVGILSVEVQEVKE